MQFLVEAGLIQEVEGREPIISLAGADLSYPDLIHVSWKGVELANADLSHARLPHMTDVDLSGANLIGANLHDSALILVNFFQSQPE
jgi:uncharacterized protein YjbI with pentapeptide repeats